LWTVFDRCGVVLHPRRSLVWVGGFDHTGTHCGSPVFRQDSRADFMQKRLSKSIMLPKDIEIDQNCFECVKRSIGIDKKNISILKSAFYKTFMKFKHYLCAHYNRNN